MKLVIKNPIPSGSYDTSNFDANIVNETLVITLPSPPLASFEHTTDYLGVAFTDTSTDTDSAITNWEWSFGDGNNSTEQNPSYSYTNSGSYSVSLTVTDGYGLFDTTSQMVSVVAAIPPTADFSVSANAGLVNIIDTSTVNTSVDANNNISAESWNFGDGSPVSTIIGNQTHTYTSSGTYTITLQVTDEVGQISTLTAQISVIVPTINASPPLYVATAVTQSITGWTGKGGYTNSISPGILGSPDGSYGRVSSIPVSSKASGIGLRNFLGAAVSNLNLTGIGISFIGVYCPGATDTDYVQLDQIVPCYNIVNNQGTNQLTTPVKLTGTPQTITIGGKSNMLGLNPTTLSSVLGSNYYPYFGVNFAFENISKTLQMSLCVDAVSITIYYSGSPVTITPSSVAPPPVSPPPPPPPVSPPPPPPPVPTSYNVPIPPNTKTDVLTHAVHAEFTDGAGVKWTFDTYVGEDATQPGVYGGFVNANGDMHPGVVGKAYADGFECGAMRMDNAYDYLGCTYAVSYDGIQLSIPFSAASSVAGLANTSLSYIALTGSTVNFWHNCCLPIVRYGKQVLWNTSNIDWSVLPSYATSPAQTLYDDSKYNYTMNGLGCASTRTMGNTGERPDIGFLPAWDLGFLTNPSDESWAVVRRASDYAGNWPYHCVHPETGSIVKITDFPQATYLPPAQTSGTAYLNNPVAQYAGSYVGTTLTTPPTLWGISASPNIGSMEHPNAYCFLSAMITRTARDLDHASMWGNYAVLGWNPYSYAKSGVRSDVQRAFAWNLRSIHLAAYYSSDTDYFLNQLEFNLAINNTWIANNKNPYGLLNYAAAYKWLGTGTPANTNLPDLTGVAVWQHSFIMLTMDAISHKDSRWIPFTQYVGSFYCTMCNSYLAPLGTNYTCMLNLNGQLITANTTLEGLAEIYNYSVMCSGYTQDQANAMTANTNQVQDTYNALVAANQALGKVWLGKCVNNVSDMMGNSQLVPDGYPAMWQMAVVSAYNANTPGSDTALSYIQNMPTKTNYTTNNKYHLQVRAK